MMRSKRTLPVKERFDVAYHFLKDFSQACKGVHTYVKKRAAIEKDYARSLLRLTQSTMDIDPDTHKGASFKSALDLAWQTVLISTKECAEMKLSAAASLEQSIMAPLTSVFDGELYKTRKEISEQGRQSTRNVEDTSQRLLKAQLVFASCSQEWQACLLQIHREGSSTDKLKSTHNQKLRDKESALGKKCEEAKLAYMSALRRANNVQHLHHFDEWPVVLTHFSQACTDTVSVARQCLVRLLEEVKMLQQSIGEPEKLLAIAPTVKALHTLDLKSYTDDFILSHMNTGKMELPRFYAFEDVVMDEAAAEVFSQKCRQECREIFIPSRLENLTRQEIDRGVYFVGSQHFTEAPEHDKDKIRTVIMASTDMVPSHKARTNVSHMLALRKAIMRSRGPQEASAGVSEGPVDLAPQPVISLVRGKIPKDMPCAPQPEALPLTLSASAIPTRHPKGSTAPQRPAKPSALSDEQRLGSIDGATKGNGRQYEPAEYTAPEPLKNNLPSSAEVKKPTKSPQPIDNISPYAWVEKSTLDGEMIIRPPIPERPARPAMPDKLVQRIEAESKLHATFPRQSASKASPQRPARVPRRSAPSVPAGSGGSHSESSDQSSADTDTVPPGRQVSSPPARSTGAPTSLGIQARSLGTGTLETTGSDPQSTPNRNQSARAATHFPPPPQSPAPVPPRPVLRAKSQDTSADRPSPDSRRSLPPEPPRLSPAQSSKQAAMVYRHTHKQYSSDDENAKSEHQPSIQGDDAACLGRPSSPAYVDVIRPQTVPREANTANRNRLSKASSADSDVCAPPLPGEEQSEYALPVSPVSMTPAAERSLSLQDQGDEYVVALPFVTQLCVQYLHSERALYTEGLFRVPGNTGHVRELKAVLNTHDMVKSSWSSDRLLATFLKEEIRNERDPNTIAGLLKSYLMESNYVDEKKCQLLVHAISGLAQSQSIRSGELVASAIGKHDLATEKANQTAVTTVRGIINDELQPVSQSILAAVCHLLSMVAKESHRNHMTSHSLAMCCGISVFPAMRVGHVAAVLQFLINNAPAVFLR
ncbi:uncharacterized protein LOC135822404 [Sycon ciliatum]|uniref:uncharacterized protein LOC135822404 n=1 Tax=Sycon ciliatum TaxID=27933 RepID=UPI0031F634DE